MRAEALRVSLDEGPRFYRWIAALFAALAWPFVRIDMYRIDVAHHASNPVVIANHRSLLDAVVGLVVFRRLGRYPRVIVAKNWFEHRGTGPLLRLAGAIPMDRDDPELHLESARRVIDAGIPIIIMPEGRLSGEPGQPTSTGEFKTGAARLARHCGVAVWPLALVGTDEVWPRDARRPCLGLRRNRRVVLVGAPEPVVIADGDPRRVTDELRDTMTDLLAEATEIHRCGAGDPVS